MTTTNERSFRTLVESAFLPLVCFGEILSDCNGKKVDASAIGDVMSALFEHAERELERGLREGGHRE